MSGCQGWWWGEMTRQGTGFGGNEDNLYIVMMDVYHLIFVQTQKMYDKSEP